MKPSQPFDLAIADDHLLFRQALKHALLTERNFTVTIEASDTLQLLHKLSPFKNAIILLDIFMPTFESCAQTIKQVFGIQPRAKIIIVTMCNDKAISERLVALGVFGIVHKSEDISELIKIILLAAEQLMMQSVAGMQVYEKGRGPANKVQFSKREVEILKLIASGKTNKEIAAHVYLSISSVEQIRAAMKDRVNSKTTIGLIRFAIDNKVI